MVVIARVTSLTLKGDKLSYLPVLRWRPQPNGWLSLSPSQIDAGRLDSYHCDVVSSPFGLAGKLGVHHGR